MYRDYKFEIKNNICSFAVKNFDLGHHPGTGYYKNKQYFLLISKNASTTVRNILTNQSWTYHIRPPQDVEKFYVILRDSYERWLSGMAEFLSNEFKNNGQEILNLLDSDSFIRMLVEVGIFDGHTAPQSWYLNTIPFNQIKFYKFKSGVVDCLLKDLNILVDYNSLKVTANSDIQSNIKNKIKDKIEKLNLKNNIIEHYQSNDIILLSKITSLH